MTVNYGTLTACGLLEMTQQNDASRLYYTEFKRTDEINDAHVQLLIDGAALSPLVIKEEIILDSKNTTKQIRKTLMNGVGFVNSIINFIQKPNRNLEGVYTLKEISNFLHKNKIPVTYIRIDDETDYATVVNIGN